jgi:hypothetical protein
MMARQPTTPSSPSARERAIDAYDSARERAGEKLSGSPLLALGGGLALGALAAALLPKTRAEIRLMGKAGSRITTSARDAYDAAKEAGREKLTELNITRDAGASAVQSLVDGLTEAARASGRAGYDAVRNKG